MRSGSDRKDSLLIDQLVGLLGNYTGALWRDGDGRAYKEMRHFQNRFPNIGDGGFDLPRCKIDFKASMMRYSQDPSKYRLAVRPRERHPGWVYVLILVEEFSLQEFDGLSALKTYLVGWVHDDDLPEHPELTGPFSGAFTVKATDLIPVIPLNYC